MLRGATGKLRKSLRILWEEAATSGHSMRHPGSIALLSNEDASWMPTMDMTTKPQILTFAQHLFYLPTF
jgi:hypothetical protein